MGFLPVNKFLLTNTEEVILLNDIIRDRDISVK